MTEPEAETAVTEEDKDIGKRFETDTFKCCVVAGGVEICEYLLSKFDSAAIEIPSEIEGRKVVSIAEEAFNSCKKITSIVIPDSVTNIGEKAFYKCESPTSLNIPFGDEGGDPERKGAESLFSPLLPPLSLFLQNTVCKVLT